MAGNLRKSHRGSGHLFEKFPHPTLRALSRLVKIANYPYTIMWHLSYPREKTLVNVSKVLPGSIVIQERLNYGPWNGRRFKILLQFGKVETVKQSHTEGAEKPHRQTHGRASVCLKL